MKKQVSYILLLILISFLIPVLLTKKMNNTKETWNEGSNLSNNQEKNLKEKDNQKGGNTNDVNSKYEQYKTVKVLHTKTNDIEEMDLDEYLYGVVSAEMPASFETEALKAQSIVARTYTLYKIIHNGGNHEGADICDDSNCCQAWISKEDRLNKWNENERNSNWEKIVRSCK